ncbi:chemotaxis protein CheW [Occallatibacter riparius]|uniref:histidine kinase n=1 Tax=Occallatibacter riparius TaxID=1002689 RepID=A0A9J7BQQ5_9BACT|nr:chemotaxis protein CheW [Occallatibacter riparius]UWZ84074.1 chemotaxis protein CheW [Occallatibacter riparius]
MDELTREFLIESQEGLDRMEHCLTDLESRPDDLEFLAEIFRAVHTIKGTTGFLGFKRLEKLAHAGENLLGLLRDGKLAATQDVITALLELLDSLRSILKIIEERGEEGEHENTVSDAELIARLDDLQIAAGSSVPKQVPVAAPLRGSQPSLAATNAEHSPTTLDPEVEHGQADSLVTPEPLSVVKTDIEKSIPAATETSKATGAPSAAESTLRVDVMLLNRMMNLVGELVLTRNQVLQATAADPRMTMLSRRLDMVTADLRESVMKARMQPVSNIFSKMPRIVRDLSQTLGRKVRLEMDGQETELDKSLLEAIKDPLTHAVRNALDHGIEAPAVRQASGKPAEGVLRLRAMQEGSHVIVEVADDGAGIDVERVREKGIERGLVSRERAAQMSEREILQMIFLPGFSTAKQITNVSGRGVGMDVVRTNVERIGGTVEIDSRPVKGTTLRLRIPLTLAIIPALIVRTLGQSFAVPQGALSELVHVPATQAASAIEWIEDAPLYRLRGQLLPLVFLDRLLGASRRAVDEMDNFIAVLDADGRRFGLVVDGLADPEEIVVKPLSPVLKKIGLYSGATVLGNAELALILDPGAIAGMAGVTMSQEVAASAAEAEADVADASRLEYLVVQVGNRQAAVALENVLRIEQVPIARIEYIGHRPVLNFSGQLLPVEDAAGLINAAQDTPEATIIVVVCREGNRQMGIAVDSVLDVARGGDLFEAGNRQPASGLTLLRDKVTRVVDLETVPALPNTAAQGSPFMSSY